MTTTRYEYPEYQRDHFVNLFKGENRYELLAAHAAMLLNGIYEERDKRRRLLERTIEEMKEKVPGVTLALNLQEELDKLNG